MILCDLAGGDRTLIRGVVAQHGPAKDRHGVCERFAKYFFSLRMAVPGPRNFDQSSQKTYFWSHKRIMILVGLLIRDRH